MVEIIDSDFSGITFLDRITDHENACAEFTRNRIAHLGQRAPLAYEALGMVLALLDCAGSCWWGCSHGDHRLEFLVARAANSAYAAILLMKRGYYDQAISSARTLGEIANLLALFTADKTAIDRWKHTTNSKRRREFTAVKVRLALELLDAPIPIDEERYRSLSSYSIHAEPDGMPQSHNERAQARTAPAYQEAGFLLALNEIALPIAFIAVFAPKLIGLSKDRAKTFQDTARVLIEAFGGVNIMEQGRPWFKLH